MINICGGESLKQIIQKRYNQECISFGEAMIDGNLPTMQYDAFCVERAKCHDVDIEEYKKHMQDFFDCVNGHLLDDITLWFGKDCFCMINLLTVLAILENKQYKRMVDLNIVDERSGEMITSTHVLLGQFTNVYDSLKDKQYVCTNNQYLDKAIQAYLNLYDDNGEIATFIKHSKLDGDKLFQEIMKNNDLGLSDVVAMKVIKRYRKDAKNIKK